MATDIEEARERGQSPRIFLEEVDDEIYISSSRGPMKVGDMHEEHAKNVLRIMLRKYKMLDDITKVIDQLEEELRSNGHTKSIVVLTVVSIE